MDAAPPESYRTLDRPGGRGRQAIEELAALETNPELGRGLGLIAALRALAATDSAEARKHLRALVEKDAGDLLIASMLADLDRAAGDPSAAARIASDTAAAATDPEFAAALRLEAAFGRWTEGDRKAAIDELEAAASGAPEAAKMVLAWASRGVDSDTADGRRRAIERALEDRRRRPSTRARAFRHGSRDGRRP